MYANVARLTTIAAILACGAFLLLERTAVGQVDVASKAPLNFKALVEGKIVILEIDDSSAVESKTSTAWLTSVEILEISGRPFAVGEYYVPETLDDDGYELNRGVTFGVAWDAIKSFRVYTEEQFGRYVADLQKHMSQ